MQEQKERTVQSQRNIDPAARAQFNQVFTNAGNLPDATIGQAPGSVAGIQGLQDVAGQPGIAGGASFLDRFLGSQGGLETSLDTLRGTAGGDLVQSNPALLDAFEANRGARESSLLGRFAAAGRSGLNPGVAEAITRANAQAELPFLAQDISTQQARQQQAAQFLPGLFGTLGSAATFAPGLQLQAGGIQEQFDRSNANARLQAAIAQQQAQLGAAGQFGQLTGGGTNTTTAPGPTDLAQFISLAGNVGTAAAGRPGGIFGQGG